MTRMLRTLLTRLARPDEGDEAQVHFHAGPYGRPVVCEDPRCDRPHLTVA
jgi:hypothetical protein